MEKENRLDKYLCYILVTELMFGAKKLNGESKPVLCVGGYEERFKEILAEIESGTQNESGQLSKQNDRKLHALIAIEFDKTDVLCEFDQMLTCSNFTL